MSSKFNPLERQYSLIDNKINLLLVETAKKVEAPVPEKKPKADDSSNLTQILLKKIKEE